VRASGRCVYSQQSSRRESPADSAVEMRVVRELEAQMVKTKKLTDAI
jgi:hypothetical protein